MLEEELVETISLFKTDWSTLDFVLRLFPSDLLSQINLITHVKSSRSE